MHLLLKFYIVLFLLFTLLQMSPFPPPPPLFYFLREVNAWLVLKLTCFVLPVVSTATAKCSGNCTKASLGWGKGFVTAGRHPGGAWIRGRGASALGPRLWDPVLSDLSRVYPSAVCVCVCGCGWGRGVGGRLREEREPRPRSPPLAKSGASLHPAKSVYAHLRCNTFDSPGRR